MKFATTVLDGAGINPQAQSDRNSNRQDHSLWIDLLRGFSALAIVIYHVRVDMWVGFWPITNHPAQYSLLDRISALFSAPVPLFRSAVMLFFLVSGFCIHFPYASVERKTGWGKFALRRFFRIYPPYFCILVLGLMVESVSSLLTGAPKSSTTKLIGSFFMLQNYQPQPGQVLSNPSLWSVPVEVELYMLYPLFLWLVRKYNLAKAMATVATVSGLSLAIILLVPGIHERCVETGQIGNAGMYWIIWCGGAAIAQWVRAGSIPRWKPGFTWLGALLAVIAAWSTFSDWFIGFQELLWAAFYFLLILWGFSKPEIPDSLPEPVARSAVFLGTLSYSLYLVHYPFFKLSAAFWVHQFGHRQSNFLVALLFVALTILPAYGFYVLCERPFHRLSQKLSRTQTARPLQRGIPAAVATAD